MKQQATIFSDVFVEINRNNDKLVIDRSTKQLKPTISRGVAEIYSEVERVFANVKTLIPYIPDYELITTKERLATYYKKIKEVGYVALDTETNGLDPITDNIAGFSIYTKGELPAYIPLTHAYYDENVSMDVAKAFMNALVRDNIKILMHNSKFDIRVIKNSIGVRLKCHFDTYIAARLLNENEEAGLKYLWPKYVKKGKAEYSFTDLFENVKFSLFDPSKVYQYAALDALMTWELWEFQREYLDPTNEKCRSQDLVDTSSLFYDIEMEVSDVAVDMEERGLRIDLDYANKLEKEYKTKMYDHEKKAQMAIMSHMDEIRKNLTANQLSKLSNPVNVSSPSQLSIILYHGLKLELSKRVVKKGKIYSTDSDAIEYLTKTYPQYSDILVELAEYKGYIKLIGTYIVGIPKLINPKTDRVHTEWKTIGADTGRFSSKNPNFQNLPSRNKDIRPMFIPRDGYKFVGSDYSQQEPRLLGSLSNDPILIENYASGRDLYATLASKAYKLPYEKCTKDTKDGKGRRNHGKTLLLALSYGMQYKSLAAQLDISDEEAKQLLDGFVDEMHVAFEFGAKVRQFCKTNGYIKTLWGRKRRFPYYSGPQYKVVGDISPEVKQSIITRIKKAHYSQRFDLMKDLENRYSVKIMDYSMEMRKAETQILNSMIQGSAADMTKVALILVARDEQMQKYGAYPVLAVHDEIIVECPDEYTEEVKIRLEELMIQAAGAKVKNVPFVAEGEVMDRWIKD